MSQILSLLISSNVSFSPNMLKIILCYKCILPSVEFWVILFFFFLNSNVGFLADFYLFL